MQRRLWLTLLESQIQIIREMKQTLRIAEEEFAALEAKESKGFK